MDILLVKRRAEALEQLLLQYAAADAEVSELLKALTPLISASKSNTIKDPLAWGAVPGSYYFSEGSLRKYADLEKTYADFKIEVTGGESPVLQKLRNGS